ncbi:riboflavin synthase [bacterium]|nr:riboflavin synthase [bacterium]
MFTGIIEGMGKVISLFPHNEGMLLTLEIPFSEDTLSAGQSICVNGVCLTLTRIEKNRGVFFISHTTAASSNLSRLKTCDKVNLERSLRLNQELGGHILTGHVDEMVAIKSIQGKDIRFSMQGNTSRFLVTRGSVAIDGISFTIASMEKDCFSITVIPHTWDNTNIKYRRAGDMVNVETDILAKYVWRCLDSMQSTLGYPLSKGLTHEKLKASGFLF